MSHVTSNKDRQQTAEYAYVNVIRTSI